MLNSLLSFSCNINKNYALEFDLLRKIRSFKDGISFISFDMNFDYYKGDHKPSFIIIFTILNLKIFEFGIYNKNHEVE